MKTQNSQLQSDLRQLKRTVGFALGIRDVLREQVTVKEAEEEIKKRIGNRAERFLELVRARIYEQPASPYRRLLKFAGCEYADLCNSVRRDGLEATLSRLASEGVYLTVGEYKGKQEVVRGGESFRVVPADLIQVEGAGYAKQTSGTRNAPVRNIMTAARLTERAFEENIFFAAHNLFSYTHAVYDGILPAGGGLNYLLGYAKVGVPVDRWFARKVPVNSRLEGWYHYLMTYLIVLMAKRYARAFPSPEFTDLADIGRIVDWVLAKNRDGKACYINTAASNAIKIARIAWERGVSLEGTKFRVRSEPFTDAKRNVIERVGASAIPTYGSADAGKVGLGCANPLHTDEVHALQYRLALVYQSGATNGEAPVQPLLFTTLDPGDTRLFLNVDIGDYAVMETRDCGCALDKVGLKLHLHHIRSYEKFTSEGMNYFYGDLFELFESVLPAEFGGGPGDYQLVEEEDGQGQTRLSLIVHPAIGELDEEKLLRRLGQALEQGSRNHRFMTKLWQDAGTFRIVRKVPSGTGRGKILPLHISR